MIRLEPTIEFAPWDWIGEKAHDVIGTPQWNTYWDKFLSTISIVPTYSGSWYISVDEIKQSETIQKILQIPSNNELPINDIVKKLTALTGGYMLFENDKVLFNPQCCCDLGDLAYWKELIDLKSESWHNLAMGHAMMYAKKEGDDIVLKEVSENINYQPIIEKVDQNHLQMAILTAEQKVSAFKKRIVPVVNKMYNDPKLSNIISEKLTGQ